MRTPRITPSPRERERFEALALPHVAVLHRVALGLMRNGADAADLVQETFLRAYRTCASFRDGTNEKAWLLTILYSIASNQFRARRRRPPEVSIEALAEAHGDEVEIGDWSGAEEILSNPRLVWDGSAAALALAALPEPFRLAVELVDLEELTYEEAALALDVPVGTLRSRLFRARRRLAERLRELERRGEAEERGA